MNIYKNEFRQIRIVEIFLPHHMNLLLTQERFFELLNIKFLFLSIKLAMEIFLWFICHSLFNLYSDQKVSK